MDKNKEQKINELLKIQLKQNTPDVFDDVLKSFKNDYLKSDNEIIDLNKHRKSNKKWLYVAASIVLVIFVSSYALNQRMFMSKKSTNRLSVSSSKTTNDFAYQSQSKSESTVQESAEGFYNYDNSAKNSSQSISTNSDRHSLASSNSQSKNMASSSSTFTNNLPTLIVSSNNVDITAIRGGYQWTIDNLDGTKTTQNADMAPLETIIKNATPLIILPDSSFTLNFSCKSSSVTINIVKDNKFTKLEIVDGKIEAPKLKGQLTCVVEATWEQGKVTYAFLIDVK